MLIEIEKYLPKQVSDVVFHTDVERDKIKDIVKGYLPFPFAGKNGILLYGRWGTGKTTLARLLPDEIEQGKGGGDAVYEYIRCMQGVTGVTVMLKITEAAKFVSLLHSGLHYFVIDEVDNLTESAQASLKSAINYPNTVFVLTTNHIDKIDKGIINRCHEIDFNAAPPESWLPLANRMLGDMGVHDVCQDALLEVIATGKGAARDILTSVVQIGIKKLRNSGKMNVIY